jgi:hypothetical protein
MGLRDDILQQLPQARTMLQLQPTASRIAVRPNDLHVVIACVSGKSYPLVVKGILLVGGGHSQVLSYG